MPGGGSATCASLVPTLGVSAAAAACAAALGAAPPMRSAARRGVVNTASMLSVAASSTTLSGSTVTCGARGAPDSGSARYLTFPPLGEC